MVSSSEHVMPLNNRALGWLCLHILFRILYNDFIKPKGLIFAIRSRLQLAVHHPLREQETWQRKTVKEFQKVLDTAPEYEISSNKNNGALLMCRMKAKLLKN